MPRQHLVWFGMIVTILFLGFESNTSIAHADTNLILNPSVEAASGSLPQNWTKSYWGSPVPTFKYPDTGHNGKGITVTLGRNSTGDAHWTSSSIKVASGEIYTFSDWYKSNTTSEVDAEFKDSNGNYSYLFLAYIPSSANAWKQLSTNVTVPNGTAQMTMTIYHLISNKGTLTTDDYSLVKISSSTPPVPPPTPTPTPTPTPSPTPTPIPTPTPTPVPTTTPTWTEGMMTFTFDDAWNSQYTNVLPVLEAANIKATFYTTSGVIQNSEPGFMTPAQVLEISQRGHEIGDHTITHPYLTQLTNTQIVSEITNSKIYLENLTGTKITTFAYPYGDYNDTVVNLIKTAGYTNARDVINTPLVSTTTDKYKLNSACVVNSTPFSTIKKYIDDAKAQKKWFIICIHQVDTSGGEYSMTPTFFKQIVDYATSTGIKILTIKDGVSLMPN